MSTRSRTTWSTTWSASSLRVHVINDPELSLEIFGVSEERFWHAFGAAPELGAPLLDLAAQPNRQTGVREIAVVSLVNEAIGMTDVVDQLPAGDQEGKQVEVAQARRGVVGVDATSRD